MKIVKNFRRASTDEINAIDRALYKLVSSLVLDTHDEFIVVKINDNPPIEDVDLPIQLKNIEFDKVSRMSDITGSNKMTVCDKNILIDMEHLNGHDCYYGLNPCANA